MICLLKVTENQARKCFNIFLNKDSSFGIRKGLNSNEGSNRWKKTPNQTSVLKNHIFPIYLKSDALQLEAKTKRKIHPRYLEYEYNLK